MIRDGDDIDWSATTWEASRREQLRRWLQMSVQERFELLEQMSELSETLAHAREQGRLSEPPKSSGH